MYQEKTVQFTPELPKEKLSAIDRLGAGLIEKVRKELFEVKLSYD